MKITIIGTIKQIETIAYGSGIREIQNLDKEFGKTKWRKVKGIAIIKLSTGNERLAEIHWYEGHGVGKRKMKIKRFLD